MAEALSVLSVYEGFFAGGARIVHTNVVTGLHGTDQAHEVLSVCSEVNREQTTQQMEQNASYLALRAAGVQVVTLGRKFNGPDRTPFTDSELATFKNAYKRARVTLSLKEQPMRLINEADASGVVACLHRSDPEHQGQSLDDLRQAITAGRIALCTISGETAKANYIAAGIPESKLRAIANGINLERFKPSVACRTQVRNELEIPSDAPTVFFVARYDAMKNVPLFVQSAGVYLKEYSDARVVACGAGMGPDNQQLKNHIAHYIGEDSHITSRIHLLGIRRDMERLYAASDVVALTSAWGEAYPLCLIEGMACGAIPVSTDVGDTRAILEGRGFITEQNAECIAAAWHEAYMCREKLRLSPAARESLGEQRMIAAYREVINEVAA